MKKRLICALFALVLLLCACEGWQNDLPDTPDESEKPLFPDTFTEKDYEGNVKAESIVRLDDKTVRIVFSAPVRAGDDLTSGAIRFGTQDDCSPKAYDYTLHDITKGADGVAWGKIVDLRFNQAIGEGGKLVLRREEGADALVAADLFLSQDGSGVLAQSLLCELSATEIALPAEPAYLVRAEVVNAVTGEMEMVFSAPVRAVGKWEQCTFLADRQYPEPGVNGSWQFSVRDVVALDPVKKGGREYATTFRLFVNLEGQKMPESGVLRVMENDKGAGDELGSTNENADIRRVVVDENGNGAMADDCSGWDVSFVPYVR